MSAAVTQTVEPLLQARAPVPAVQTALLRPTRRRALRGTLAWGGVALGAALVCGQESRGQWASIGADLSTGTGERRRITLPDGSELVLNARSAVDVRFDAQRRSLRLRAGELIVTVAPNAARPFSVQSHEGEVQALGTRFMVRQEAGRTVALVLEHHVQAKNLAGAVRQLREGESVVFNAQQMDPIQLDRKSLAGWESGMLLAADLPLGDVIDALRPYRRGFIRVSPEATRLRVLGAFPLDDPERVLDSLAQTLPLRVTRYGPWMAVLDRRD
ncbi:MAG: hypothetical protein EOO29_49345 [Comamonadaceae bacterium]|nr:MAG: hypothetical protein EOO29_49345 [Comamonadaceae bacterium]